MDYNQNIKTKIAVIGGGAAGLMAAISASKPFTEVVIFETKDTPGKKINATGNGKCNYTNQDFDFKHFRCSDSNFVAGALNQFGYDNIIKFFDSIGISPKIKNGYVYPRSEQAASVSSALILTAKEKGVSIVNEEIKTISFMDPVFLVNKKPFDRVILACGSYASMKDTKNFNGYELAKTFGHSIIKPVPALVQLEAKEKFLKTINGVRMEASIRLLKEGQVLASEEGEILFTDYGISGIPVLQLSRYAARHFAGSKESLQLSIDLLPEMDKLALKDELEKRRRFKRTAEEVMIGLFNHKLNYVLCNLALINSTAPVDFSIKDNNLFKLIENIKDFRLTIVGTKPFENAQVVSGGVDTTEVDAFTMESKLRPGLFFAGEILDVDGTCGGYNLSWAWSSGYVAGQNAAKMIII